MNGLRRTFSSPNLTPSGSNGSFNPHGGNYSQNYNDYGQGGLGQGGGFNQGQNGQFNQRHSMNYGRSNPYQVKQLRKLNLSKKLSSVSTIFNIFVRGGLQTVANSNLSVSSISVKCVSNKDIGSIL